MTGRLGTRLLAFVAALGLIALLGSLGARPAAADEGDRIGSYAITVALHNDGTAQVTERFDYTFASPQRWMPFEWTRPVRLGIADDATDTRLISYADPQVTRDGHDVPTWVRPDAWWRRSWIGPFDALPTGTHRYEIRYQVSGITVPGSTELPAGRGAGEAVEAVWLDWWALPALDAPIDRATIRVEAPPNGSTRHGTMPVVRLDRPGCQVDPANGGRCTVTTSKGSTSAGPSDGSEGSAGASFTVTATGLAARANVRVYAGVPSGVAASSERAALPGVPELITANLQRPGERAGLPTPALLGILAGLVACAAIGCVLVGRAIRAGSNGRRLRDLGALIALAGVALGYPLAAYDLAALAVPIVLGGLGLVGVAFSAGAAGQQGQQGRQGQHSGRAGGGRIGSGARTPTEEAFRP